MSFGGALGLAGAGLGIASGLASGKPTGEANAALSAAKLAAGKNAFGANSGSVNQGAGIGLNALGIYTGLQQGGVKGDASAAVNAAQLGGRLGAFGSSSGAIGAAAGYAAAPLAVYNAVSNWKSGDTANDTINGAEAGAAIGSVVPVVGTAIGALVGGAVGAISSAFGPGKEDPENVSWNNYAAAYQKNPSNLDGSPSQNFQTLAGIFDSRGSQVPFYNQFGRMGEDKFMSAMGAQVNDALSSGTISKNASASDIYSKVVQPWITQMGGSSGWKDTNTVKGVPEKAAVGNLLTNIIGQWQSGSSFQGIGGNTISMPQFGGSSGASSTTSTAGRTSSSPVLYSRARSAQA